MALQRKIDWTAGMRHLRNDRRPANPGLMAARSLEIARLDRLAKEAGARPFFVAGSFDRSAITTAAIAMAPEFPAALIKTVNDWELGLCSRPRHAAEDTFGRDLVEQLRRKPIVRGVQQPAPEKGENRTKTVLEPWPEAQARADEIVAVWDKYLADMRTAREQSGFEKADEAAREAVAEFHELEGRIVRTRAKTPQGMLVNARMAAVGPTTVSTVDDLEHALQERLDTGHIIGLSLILDVLNLHGGDA